VIPADLSAVKLALMAHRFRAETEGLDLLRAEPIAIVGIGCSFPGGADSPAAFWDLLARGGDAVREMSPERAALGSLAATSPLRGGFLDRRIDLFDYDFFAISQAEAMSMDPQQRILHEVAWEAVEDAGLLRERLAESATGVFIGLSSQDMALLAGRDLDRLRNVGLGFAHNMAANRLSYLLDLRGPSLEVDTACSSSLVAVHLACSHLRSGECDLALAGGVHLIAAPELASAYASLGLLAKDGNCKAFDAGADGFGRGEGCGVVVLKRLSDALADRDPIRAVIRGSAVNQDGRSNGIAAPNGLAQREVFRRALANAGISPARLGYIEAHGAGTPLGDLIEVEALAEVLGGGDGEPWCALGAVKTNIGHSEAAAGIASLIKTVLVLENGAIPPNLHCRTLHPEIARLRTPFAMPRELRPWPAGRPRLAGVHSFGMGGTNAHVILEGAPSTPGLTPGEPAVPGGPARLLPLSAHTAEVLRERVRSLRDFLAGLGQGLPLADVCYTAGVRRTHHSQRLAAIASTTEEMADLLTQALDEGSDLAGRVVSRGEGPQTESGALWAGGGSPDWTRLYPEGGRPVRLPVYPYQPSVCWRSETALQLQARGSDLDSLELRSVPRRPPGANEVEIRVAATGLSFRDVLAVLGMLPGEVGPLGNECAGRIVAVGVGVEGMYPGDEVVAVAEGSFAAFLTVDARCVARKPENLSFEDAAGLPIVFLTATEALLDVSRLTAGERVLVHAAAGGVGLAALQLAQSLGAEVFATAGSPAKRELLATLGVRHVFDSRSTAFAEQILEITGGEGVHVVLNSLAGDLLERSLEILAPGGRFVEIGERNVLPPARVAALPRHVTYAHLDLLQELKADPEAFGRRLRALLDRFAAGELRPLPRRTFPLDRAAEAFRFMSRAQHVGKIVLVQPDGGAPAPAPNAAAPARPAAAALPSGFSEALRRAAPGERRRLLEGSIRELVARLLGLGGPAEVDPRRPLGEQGLHSLESVELRNLLSSLVGRPLTAALVYNHPTVEALAELLSQEAGAPRDHALEGPASACSPRADEPIAVIGVGCRFPGGVDGPTALWKLLCAGVDAVTEVPSERWDVDAYYDPDPHRLGTMNTRWGSFLADADRFDAPFFQISPREATAMDPQQRLLLEVAWEALENAGVNPDRLAGTATGVFVGMCSNSYWNLYMAHGGAERLDGDFVTGNIASVASGRLSYVLGLHGPSLTLDTACSSSLVAVHLACQSLRRGESDLALAGGVNLILSPELHILSSRLGVMARDGRCKTFDAAADGYSRGEGCGVVVVKRLSDALADGDPILAVVQGTAVNQDGRSSALTAPNGLSQEMVLRSALKDAGLAPAAIDYVETHGSGTPLGDVIELGALGAVLGRGRPADRPLLVGSVKTNFGHLEAAAGIAGFIKAALSVAHGRVPPHLHLRTPNPEVPFTELNLRVPGALEPWPAGEGPRRAGVSAFGLSGTNAHVVLAEAPPLPSASEPRPWQLLPVSAKTASALETATANLATFLRREPAVDLADVAHTLQVGRSAFLHRRFVLCRSASEGVDRIETLDPSGVFTHAQQPGARPVVFLLGGVGDQYVEMGLGLYQTEPGFRRVVDRCAELLAPRLGLDLREVLYPRGTRAPELQEPAGEGLDLRSLLRRASAPDDLLAARLSRTAIAQPALFTIEYALASLWMEWGIRPQAMIGHSLGEYVAACLAGVLSLEDTLTLVAERGRWIEQLPGGAMLTVPLSEAEVTSLLGSELSLAAVNGPASCVVSGPAEVVGELERRLADLGVPASRPRTSHAFHSPLLGSIASPLTELARSMPRQRANIPYLSNVTGRWITPEEATDPGYWARHMVQTVRFEAGVRELLSDPALILLEIGPGQALGSFVRQHPECAPDRVVLSSLRHASYREADPPFLLRSLGRLWLAGAEVDWAGFHVHGKRHRVALPTYPFERQRYWIGGTEERPRVAGMEDLPRKPDVGDWFYLPVWRESAPCRSEKVEGSCLLFLDTHGLGERLAVELRRRGTRVVTVSAGERFQAAGPDAYEIHPGLRSHYDALFAALRSNSVLPRQIVHLWGVTGGDPLPPDPLENGFSSLLLLAQALGGAAAAPCTISVVCDHLHSVTGEETLQPEKALVLGPCTTIPLELPSFWCRSIDIAHPVSDALVESLIGELAGGESQVGLRGRRRWARTFAPVHLGPEASAGAPLREQGVYLITGGTGGIGLAVAEDLAKTCRARLALVGRSGLPEGSPAVAFASPETEGKLRALHAVQALRAGGTEVLVLQADVADPAQARRAVEETVRHFGTLNGVIHAAGVPGAGLIERKTLAEAAAVLAPKVLGTLALEQALEGLEIDFLALFSSIAAISGGGPGQVDYCAANAFLDAFAQARASGRRLTVSIDWGEWRWDAWGAARSGPDAGLSAFFRDNRSRVGIAFEEGTEAFRRILSLRSPQVVVSTQDLDGFLELGRSFTAVRAGEQMERDRASGPAHPRPALGTSYVAPGDGLQRRMAAIWQELLGIDRVGIHDNFFDLGGNSLLGISLIARIRKDLETELSRHALYEAPTVSALVERITTGAEDDFEEWRDRGERRRTRQRQRRREPDEGTAIL
jgi:acyl transferase domain-containing protein/acyl carrier protein